MIYDSAEAEIDRQMLAAIEELDAAAAAGEMNHFLAKLLGAVANLLGYRDILERVESLLAPLSAADFFGAAITNIDWRNLGADQLERMRRIERATAFGADHPVYNRDAPVPDLEHLAQGCAHLQLCLQGDVDGAIRVAKSDLDYEEIADTLAALGKFDDAIALIDSQPVSGERRRGVRFVGLVEKCRRLMPTFADEIARFEPKQSDRLPIVLALAQRRPWVGYPYPDY